MPRLLILGGTGEAYALAEQAARLPGLTVITSLAGRTRAPRLPAGELRIGGFGGAAGLAEYLRRESIDLLIDATHPFAARMSRQAAEAAAACELPRLLLLRPPWQEEPGDRWRRVPDLAAAAAALPAPARVFLAIGRRELEPFARRSDVQYLLRLVDRPEASPLPGAELLLDRGPFTEEGERALLRDRRIELLVSKNSGGAGGYAKLAAARSLALPVVMVERPEKPAGPRVESVAEALAWLAQPLA